MGLVVFWNIGDWEGGGVNKKERKMGKEGSKEGQGRGGWIR